MTLGRAINGPYSRYQTIVPTLLTAFNVNEKSQLAIVNAIQLPVRRYLVGRSGAWQFVRWQKEIEKRREVVLPAFGVDSWVLPARSRIDQLPDQDSNLEQTG